MTHDEHQERVDRMWEREEERLSNARFVEGKTTSDGFPVEGEDEGDTDETERLPA